LPKKYFDSSRKNCYANLQNCFARFTPPNNYLVKIENPGFRVLYFVGQNEFRFFSFNKYKKYIFFIFGCWLLSKKFSVCEKNNGFTRLGEGATAAPSP